MRKALTLAVVASLAVACTGAGSDGSPGQAGLTGPQGPTGASGPAGVAGPAGPQGLPGLDGMAGAAGPSGPAGTAGADGPSGPQGLPGADGPTGPTGPRGPSFAAAPWTDGSYNQHMTDLATGVWTTIASLTLAEGSYLLFGKVGLYNLAGAVTTVDCQLYQGMASNVLDSIYVTNFPSAATSSLPLQAATKVPAGGATVTLACLTGLGTMRVWFPHLAAIQVGTLAAP